MRIIPARPSIEAPPGEIALFEAFAAAEGTDDWIAIYSLRLAEHPRQQRGETDFVVVVPSEGVAVIEVKSHKSVERGRDGSWKLGRSKPTTRSPFQQADDARFAIRDFLSSRISMRSVHVESCVWFTHLAARRELPSSIEWAPWQVLDETDLHDDPVAAVRRVLAEGRADRERLGRPVPEPVGPTWPQAQQITELLRPQVSVSLSPAQVRAARELELERLLDEQADQLDDIAVNDRILVTGPAGCGKTFLALEVARRQSAAGGRCLFLCYNHALSRHLQEATRGLDGVVVSTLPALMVSLAGAVPPPDSDHGFWDEELPRLAADALLEQSIPLFDYVVLDEAQDMMRPGFLDVVDLLLVGGLRSGRWCFFGDFDDQVIYQGAPATARAGSAAGTGPADRADTNEGRAVLAARTGSFTAMRLRTNCRNTPQVAAAVQRWTGHPDAYRRVRRHAEGEVPTLSVYDDEQAQQRLLLEAVRAAREAGFALAEIVILSRHIDSAAARCTDGWLAPLLVDARRGGPVAKGRVRFSTIHSFKGLEAPAVILTDISTSARGPYRDLLNVGCTRARDWLRVLATRDGLAQLGIAPPGVNGAG